MLKIINLFIILISISIQLSATESDPCPIMDQTEPELINKSKKKYLIIYDVGIEKEEDFQKCEDKIAALILCDKFKRTKKIDIRLRSTVLGPTGTIAKMTGKCIKQRNPASSKGKSSKLKFKLSKPLRLERKIEDSGDEDEENI